MKLTLVPTTEWQQTDLETMRAVLAEVERRSSSAGISHSTTKAQTRQKGARELDMKTTEASREVAGHVPAFRLVTVKCDETQVTTVFHEDPAMKRIVDFYYGELKDTGENAIQSSNRNYYY